MGFGKLLWATFILVAAVAVLQSYDSRLAYGLAVITLLALFFANPTAQNEIARILGLPYTTGAQPGGDH